MLTKDDKKFIIDSIKNNNDVLVKDMLDLFTVTNERIDKLDEKLSNKIDGVNKSFGERLDDTNERIDKVLDQLRDDDESINDHEKRIEKIEEKVFVALS